LHLRSGIAPLKEMFKKGVRLAQGLDGFSVDDDDDAFRELRLNYMVHQGLGLEEGIPARDLLRAACHEGRRVVTREDGLDTILTAGGPADFMVIDREFLTSGSIIPMENEALVVRKATKESLMRLFVAGREIVREGEILGVDLEATQQELNAQVKHAGDPYQDWRQVTTAWANVLRTAYAAGMHRRQ
jgi:5-methylthioadenosine/S-adenosylhomocysteine deaminase